MGETTRQIEKHIRDTRSNLSENLSELEKKVKSATDWRHYYENYPGAFFAAAVGSGILVSLLSNRRRGYAPSTGAASAAASPAATSGVMGPINESISEIKGALAAVAANQAKSFISKLIPGFEEQLARGKDSSQT